MWMWEKKNHWTLNVERKSLSEGKSKILQEMGGRRNSVEWKIIQIFNLTLVDEGFEFHLTIFQYFSTFSKFINFEWNWMFDIIQWWMMKLKRSFFTSLFSVAINILLQNFKSPPSTTSRRFTNSSFHVKSNMMKSFCLLFRILNFSHALNLSSNSSGSRMIDVYTIVHGIILCE